MSTIHTTQCPSCLSVYNITEEQYQASSGKVRCGRCRQRFTVEFLSDNDHYISSKDELITEEEVMFDSSQNFEHDIEEVEADNELDTHNANDDTDNSEADTELESVNTEDTEIIDEIDQLITEKVLPANLTEETETVPENSDSEEEVWLLDPHKKKRNIFVRMFFSLILFAMILGLSAVLLYQLWLRQQVNWLEADYINPALDYASEKFEIDIPVRQDLSGLRLISAVVEPHPSRSSTILVKVSLINRSKIGQPFPWLQLTLTDKDGRMIARRALSPQDYLHNNNTENLIPSNVQKVVSIETLAFPNHAHGYELRLLRKD